MNKTVITPWIIIALLVAALFVIYTKPNDNVDMKELVKTNEELRKTLDKYEAYSDSINTILAQYEDSIETLNKTKTKIITKYEKDLSNIWNPAVVSNDSISRFISAKIRHSW